jgi:hypothetical protein
MKKPTNMSPETIGLSFALKLNFSEAGGVGSPGQASILRISTPDGRNDQSGAAPTRWVGQR